MVVVAISAAESESDPCLEVFGALQSMGHRGAVTWMSDSGGIQWMSQR